MFDNNGNYSVDAHVSSLSDKQVRQMLAAIPPHSIGSPLHLALLERTTN